MRWPRWLARWGKLWLGCGIIAPGRKARIRRVAVTGATRTRIIVKALIGPAIEKVKNIEDHEMQGLRAEIDQQACIEGPAAIRVGSAGMNEGNSGGIKCGEACLDGAELIEGRDRCIREFGCELGCIGLLLIGLVLRTGKLTYNICSGPAGTYVLS